MTQKGIFWFVVLSILAGTLAFFIHWILEGNRGNWTMADMQTKCLNQPLAIIPSNMPQRKPYDEYFSRLSYKFPSWWVPQLDATRYNLMPVVNTKPVTRPVYYKIVTDGKDIWFTYSPDSSLARYDIQANEIKSYTILDEINHPYRISDLYLTRNNVLWVTLNSLQPNGGYSVLARYQPDKDKFEVVTDQDGLFKLSKKGWAFQISDKKLAELTNGQLAVVIDEDIYLYNPATNRAKLLLDNGDVESIAIGKDNNIWFVNNYPDFDVRVVDTETGKVTDYGVPPQLDKNIKTQAELLEATKAIAVDQQGRVWVSYFDRLEPNESGGYDWHSLNLPPLFVNTFDPYYSYRWANVFSTHVFSDGNIWFASDIGIVKYDVSNNDWCLSATVKTFANYSIAEDASGNIWTIVDNQIYKFAQ